MTSFSMVGCKRKIKKCCNKVKHKREAYDKAKYELEEKKNKKDLIDLFDPIDQVPPMMNSPSASS